MTEQPTVPTGIDAEQYKVLMQDLAPHRVSSRNVGGRNASYLEAWDVKAHLTRLFGFGSYDNEVVDEEFIGTREYKSSGDNPKDMVEVIWRARVRLTVRDKTGHQLCTHVEGAISGQSGPANTIGDLHDNALKAAASDALKRCATNLGTQFGLSLYANGSKADVIKRVLVVPEGVETPTTGPVGPDAEARAAAATQVNERIGALSDEGRRKLTVMWTEAGFPNVAQISTEQAAVANGWLDNLEAEAGAEAAKERLGAQEVKDEAASA